MKSYILLLAIALIFMSFPSAYSQTGTSPFTLETELVSMPNAPRLHSSAFAQSNGKWLFIGGRINGLHGFNFGESFPPGYENKYIWVVDPVSNQSWSVNLFSYLNISKADPLRSMNMEFAQSGDKLYMIGGFGLDSLKDSLVTFPVVSVIDVNATIQAVINGTNFDSHIRQLSDERMRVCGGGLEPLGNYFFLAGGQNFWGDYTRFGNNNQIYSNKIKKFYINDNGTTVSITNYTDYTDTVNYHRRDFNFVPSIKSDGTFGLTLYGGVFTYNTNIAYQNPIYIDNSSFIIDTSYQQLMSQYTTAHIVTYDSVNYKLNTTFLGGTSMYYFNTGSQSLVRDELIPFIKDVTTLARTSGGVSSEFVHSYHFPYYVGTNALFIPDPSVPVYDNGIIKLQSLQGRAFVGYLFGGILADIPNFATSNSSDKVYKVYITKNPIGIRPIGTETPSTYKLFQNYPNPFNPATIIRFDIPSNVTNQTANVKLVVYDALGRETAVLIDKEMKSGSYEVSWSATGEYGNIASGLYFYKLDAVDAGNTANSFTQTRKMILVK